MRKRSRKCAKRAIRPFILVYTGIVPHGTRASSAMRIFHSRKLSSAGPERGRGAGGCLPLLAQAPRPNCSGRSRGAPRARSFHVRALPSGGELGAQLRKSLAMGMCEYQECPQSLISPLESADPKNSLRKSFAICSYTKTQGGTPRLPTLCSASRCLDPSWSERYSGCCRTGHNRFEGFSDAPRIS